MGWRDQSHPADVQPNAPAAAAPASAAPAAAPAAAPQSGWRTQSKPADAQPNTSTPPPASTPADAGPKPGEPGNETLPWFSATGNDKVGAWVNSAIDSATMGGADYLQGKLNENLGGSSLAKSLGINDPSQNVAALRKQTEQLRGDIGPIGSLTADLAGGVLGPVGELGAGAKIAKLIAPKAAVVLGEKAAPIAARMVGSGVENAGASAGGTVGHGGSWDDALQSAKVGGSIGALVGAVPGGRGSQAPSKGPITDAIGLGAKSPTADLQAGEKAAFSPLSGVHYDPADVAVHFDPVTSNLSSGDRVALGGTTLKGAADDVSKELMDKYNKGLTVTASDIAKFKRTLMDKATNADETRIAGDYGRSLDTALATKTPQRWGSVTPGTNMSDAVNQAVKASSKAKSSADIDAWIQGAQGGDKSVPGDIKKTLANTGFFNAEEPTRPLLQQAGDYKPSWLGSAARVGGERALGGAVGEGVNYVTGGTLPWWAAAGMGAGFGHGASALIPKGAPNALIEKLAQARAANAIGDAGFRPDFNPGVKGFGPLITYARQGFPGIGASGAFSPNNPQ